MRHLTVAYFFGVVADLGFNAMLNAFVSLIRLVVLRPVWGAH